MKYQQWRNNGVMASIIIIISIMAANGENNV